MRFGETSTDACYRFEDEQNEHVRIESMDGTRTWGPPPDQDAPRSMYFQYRTDIHPRDQFPWLQKDWLEKIKRSDEDDPSSVE